MHMVFHCGDVILCSPPCCLPSLLGGKRWTGEKRRRFALKERLIKMRSCNAVYGVAYMGWCLLLKQRESGCRGRTDTSAGCWVLLSWNAAPSWLQSKALAMMDAFSALYFHMWWGNQPLEKGTLERYHGTACAALSCQFRGLISTEPPVDLRHKCSFL